MNYIKELNAFYDWLETNSLSTSAIVLWHALMHINNKSGWAEEFGVATSVLCIKTGLSERAIRNARNELKQKGRIDWKSRKGNQSAIYKMISLFKEVPATIADNVSGNTSGNCSGNCSGNASALNKLNETKPNYINTTSTTEEKEDIFDEEFKELAQLYQKCGFEYNGLTPDWLIDLKNRFGFEWIKNALLEAERQGKRTKKYVEGILQNWRRDGGMKLSSDNKNPETQKPETNSRKNKFHNFEQRTDNYTADQLEEIARRKREEYFKKAQEGGK